MVWAANAERRRAFKVVGRRKGELLLKNAVGAKFRETPADLEANGYRIVKRKPAYAEKGHY